jgi:hypothetical protein
MTIIIKSLVSAIRVIDKGDRWALVNDASMDPHRSPWMHVGVSKEYAQTTHSRVG